MGLPVFSGRVWTNTMGLAGDVVYTMDLSVFSWEGVGEYDGPWQGKWFIKWVCQFFSWERVNKDDGQGEVYKMRRSNLCVLCIFVVFFSTVVVSNTSLHGPTTLSRTSSELAL